MTKLLFCVFVLTIGYVLCDGDAWIKEDEKPVESVQDNSESAYVPVEDKPSVDKPAENKPAEDKPAEDKPADSSMPVVNAGSSSSSESPSTESTTTTTAKPPPSTYGCTTPMWSDQKYCWKRCTTGSTSSFWNTWCFTTKGGENSTKVECSENEQCQPDNGQGELWECKSSCGMFSPHWDREGAEKEESTLPPNNE